MNKTEIIKEFVKYCDDTKQQTKSKKAKFDFSKRLTMFLYNIKKIQLDEIEATNKNIFNTLKYNPLSIEKIKKEVLKKGVKI